MWLPPDLLELCHSITHSQHDSPPISTQQSSPEVHQHILPPSRLLRGPRNQSTQHSAFPILQLPMDILAMHLPLHLPYDSLIALRVANRSLYTAIPAPKKRSFNELSECERKAVLTAMEEREEQSTRRCCVICKSWYPIALFSWVPDHNTRLDDYHGDENGAVAENRVCRWHRARFERTIARSAFVKELPEEGWTQEEACMHCGGVLAWDRCGCKTTCPSCWKREVWCYTRVID